jgi:hypothetical protein
LLLDPGNTEARQLQAKIELDALLEQARNAAKLGNDAEFLENLRAASKVKPNAIRAIATAWLQTQSDILETSREYGTGEGSLDARIQARKAKKLAQISNVAFLLLLCSTLGTLPEESSASRSPVTTPLILLTVAAAIAIFYFSGKWLRAKRRASVRRARSKNPDRKRAVFTLRC